MQKQNPTDFSNTGQTEPESSREDLAAIFNYPAIGELFSESDSSRLDDFYTKLNSTRDNLERIIRYGSKPEAESAMRAVRGIEITLEFLQNLQKRRLSEIK